jgi:GNAT superfamily N-acetyltransferase
MQTCDETACKADIRRASETDVPVILQLIRELAEYEKLPHEVVATEASLKQTLFGAKPYAEALLAYADGEPVGLCLYFHNYSTFLSKPGLYIEDIFVRPAYRGQGVGKAFFRVVAGIAQERGCGRMEWWVLDWNTPAIDFYKKLGARGMSEFTVYRLTEEQFAEMA